MPSFGMWRHNNESPTPKTWTMFGGGIISTTMPCLGDFGGLYKEGLSLGRKSHLPWALREHLSERIERNSPKVVVECLGCSWALLGFQRVEFMWVWETLVRIVCRVPKIYFRWPVVPFSWLEKVAALVRVPKLLRLLCALRTSTKRLVSWVAFFILNLLLLKHCKFVNLVKGRQHFYWSVRPLYRSSEEPIQL